MKENTIHALLQLLALIANVREGKVSAKAEKIIHDILKRVVRSDKLNDYLDEFRNLVLTNFKINIGKESAPSERKKRASQSVKALVICAKSNEVLQQHEKIRIISRLIEFANEDGIISPKEREFLLVVKDTFNIDDAEYNDISSMILNPLMQGVRKNKIIRITGVDVSNQPKEKQILRKGLNGEIIALFIESGNLYMIKYLGREILYKNAQTMIPGSVEFLDPNSFIRSKKIAPIYYSTINSRFLQDQIVRNLEYVVDEVAYKFRNSENGVHSFSLTAGSGELIGIMGGSGVGKSTLLNLMNGNLAPQHGKIFINGLDLQVHKEELEGIIGYIPQDDLLIEDLTVFQNLYYSSKLCFGNYSELKLLKSIVKILKELDLYDIRHLKVGNPLDKYISGGQRKRLNIGLELIREPSILFVDEPTSGLSSMDAETVMLLLKRQTNNGKIVIVNIHQPSSYIYKLLNNVLVMDKGGYMVYQGDPLEALVYFKTINEQINAEESQCETCGNVNPEQILEIVETKYVNEFGRLTGIRRYRPRIWYEKYKENFSKSGKIRIKQLPLPQINITKPNKWHQFLSYVQRDISAKLVNRQYLIITLLEGPLLALIIGYFTKYFSGTPDNPDAYVFSQNANLVSYLFMSVVVAMFLGMVVSAEEIIKDSNILKRESFLNLSRFSYLNSKILIVFFISALQMICYILIGNYMLEIKGMTMTYWLILFSAAATANLIGLNISAALKSVASIYIVIPMVLVPMILFSGTVVPFDRLRSFSKHSSNVPLVGDLMTSRWAFEALAVIQFKNNRFEKNFFQEEMTISQANYKNNYLFPRMKSMLNDAVNGLPYKANQEKFHRKIRILKKEIHELGEETGITFPWPSESIKSSVFSHMATDMETYIDSLTKFLLLRSNVARNAKDLKYEQLERELGGKEALINFQNRYTNESITDLVLNRNRLHKIMETRDGFIQLMDPVFKIPDSKLGRAQMYAPYKRVGPFHINTFLFNLLIIWITTCIAALVLYFGLLRKLLEIFESFRIKRIELKVGKLLRLYENDHHRLR